MAIAFDAASALAQKSGEPAVSPLTWTHTTGTGSNRFLVVGICVMGSSAPNVTGVTHDGVSMTKARSDNVNSGPYYIQSSIWFLHNPTSGAKTVSVAFSGSATYIVLGGSTSYTGAAQTSAADAVNGKTGTATYGNQTFSVTTVADNCWIAIVGYNLMSACDALQTVRVSGGSDADLLEDTNAAQTPAGAKTVGFTMSTEENLCWAMSAASFAPVADTATYSGRGVGRGIGRGIFR